MLLRTLFVRFAFFVSLLGALPALRAATIGASVPWVRYEAEDGARSSGALLLAGNRTSGDPAGEASGRKAVRLRATGDYIEWPVTSTATALVIRLSIPDAPTGGGLDATLGIYKAGARVQSISVTSKYAWVYGPDNGTFDQTTFNNNPANGAPHRIYDESSVLLTTTFQPGDTIRIQKGAEDTAAYYDVDLIELENPVELAPPANSISIVSKGATPNDDTDDSDAIVAAIAEAKSTGKSVWMPRGVYKTKKQIAVFGVTLQGAGMWFTEVDYTGTSATDFGAFAITASNTKLSDFRIMGSETFRNNSFRGILGPFGSDSEVDNVWIEHTTAGIWVGINGNALVPTNLRFSGCRIRDTFADGIDLQNGCLNCTIENCTTRNTGDDALVIWSLRGNNTRACTGNTIRNCTTECTWFGGGMALYGGANTVDSNYIADSMLGAGLKIEQEFGSFPFTDTTTIHNNALVRCGGAFFNAQELESIVVVAFDGPLAGAVTLQDNTVTDSTFGALSFQSVSGNAITGPVKIDGLAVDGAKTLVWVKGNALGSATLSRVTAANIAQTTILRQDAAATFTLNGFPQITAPPANQAVAASQAATLTATATALTTPTLQWTRNGTNVPNATSATLTLANVQPIDTGIYALNATASNTTATSLGAIVGLSSAVKLVGNGTEFPNIVHPVTGYTYDQILLQDTAATITADPGQITRMSYVDLSNDIVQVEFSGPGALSLVLDAVSGPATPAYYNQPTVSYMKGHAGIVITGATENTHLSVFAVGSLVNPNLALYRTDVTYDGYADIAFVAIASANGKFGGLRTANASYFATKGLTGVYAPGVTFTGPVFVHDINASDAATPVLIIGGGSDTRITGGDLLQANGKAVQVSGLTQLKFAAGASAQGVITAGQPNKGVLVQGSTDVTASVVVNP